MDPRFGVILYLCPTIISLFFFLAPVWNFWILITLFFFITIYLTGIKIDVIRKSETEKADVFYPNNIVEQIDIFTLLPCKADLMLVLTLNSSVLLYKGKRTKCLTPGNEIEFQYRIGNEFLIITSEGDPWEDSTYFLLLNIGFEIIDRKYFGFPCKSIFMMEHQDKTDFRFRFFEDDDNSFRKLSVVDSKMKFVG
jgi:hypothetical protein